MATDPPKVNPEHIVASDAEYAFVGCVFVGVLEQLPRVADLVTPEMFFDERCGLAYELVLSMWERGIPVDLVTVKDHLRSTTDKRKKNQSLLEAVDGVPWIVQCVESGPSQVHAEYYGRIVRRFYFKRKLLAAVEHLEIALGQNAGADDELFADAESELDRAKGFAVEATGQASVPFATVGRRVMADTKDRTVRTTCEALDDDWGGVQAGDYMMIAGRPSHGKSTLAMNFTAAMAESGLRVAVFSLEMGSDDWWIHTASCLLGINAKTIRRKHELTREQVARLKIANEHPTFVEKMLFQERSFNVRDVCAGVRSLARNEGVTAVVVDYLQLLSTGRVLKEYERVTEVSRRLCQATKESGVVMMAVAQLNRGSENTQRYTPKQRTPKQQPAAAYQQAAKEVDPGRDPARKREPSWPRLSDLRGSGALEQDADWVLLIHQPSREDDTAIDERYRNMVRLHCAKQRKGTCGTRWLKFEPECLAFRLQQRGFNPIASSDATTSVDRSIHLARREQAAIEISQWTTPEPIGATHGTDDDGIPF